MTVTRRLALLVPLALLAGLLTTSTASARTNEDEFSPNLPSGHCLTTTHDNPVPMLETTSKRFTFTVFSSGQLTLENHVALFGSGGLGYGTWDFFPQHPGRRATLCMQRDGDLVLRKNGVRAWHSATAIAGASARLTEGGRLVVRTRAGRVVWSTRTTAVLMIAGDRLAAGAGLVNRTAPGGTTHLIMRRSGDLVLLVGHHRVWHTNTHVRGSHAYVTAHGRLAVVTPGHRFVWRSAAEGRKAVLMVAQHGRLVLGTVPDSRCVVLPRGANPDCGTG